MGVYGAEKSADVALRCFRHLPPGLSHDRMQMTARRFISPPLAQLSQDFENVLFVQRDRADQALQR